MLSTAFNGFHFRQKRARRVPLLSTWFVPLLHGTPYSVPLYGSQTRSFQYVADLVEGLVRLMNCAYNQPVNLGNPDEYTILQFAVVITDLVGGESDVVHKEAVVDDPTRRRPDITRAKNILAWEPKISLRDGLAATVKYFRKELTKLADWKSATEDEEERKEAKSEDNKAGRAEVNKYCAELDTLKDVADRAVDIVTCRTIRQERWIRKAIKEGIKKSRQGFKLLLLGTEGVGKSTILRQMQIIHDHRFPDPVYRKTFAPAIRLNVVEAMDALLLAIEELDLPRTVHPARREDADFVKVECKKEQNQENLQRLFACVARLWKDPGVLECYGRRSEFRFIRLIDSAKYFLDRCLLIAREDYVPTEQDVLRMRQSSTGIEEWTFTMGLNLNFRVVDVGGLNTERRKWIHCFDSISSILFVAALSDYDQTAVSWNTQMMRTETVRRLRESLELFRIIVQEPCLKTASLILLLNKTDVFAERIHERHLEDFVPQYKQYYFDLTGETGPKNDTAAGKAFILALYSACVESQPSPSSRQGGAARKEARRKHGERPLYAHFTCATDTEAMSVVMQSVENLHVQRTSAEFCLE